MVGRIGGGGGGVGTVGAVEGGEQGVVPPSAKVDALNAGDAEAHRVRSQVAGGAGAAVRPKTLEKGSVLVDRAGGIVGGGVPGGVAEGEKIGNDDSGCNGGQGQNTTKERKAETETMRLFRERTDEHKAIPPGTRAAEIELRVRNANGVQHAAPCGWGP